jgi:hypothetical protein
MAGCAVSTAGFFLLVLARWPGWSMCLVLLAALSAAVFPSGVSARMTWRLATCFALLAVCDFLKRITFLAPDQAAWSQYAVFLFPYAYFGLFILVPYALDQYRKPVSRLIVLTFLYLGVALANTWMAADHGLMSKLTATALLILPWTMVLVGAAYGDSLRRVAWALFICGLASTLYGLLQLAGGPTVVERRWAEAAGGFSIGAGRLASVLGGTSANDSIWRVNGFQPDALTFGLFTINALAACWLLKRTRQIGRGTASIVGTLLVAGAVVCLVRTVWVALAAFVGFTVLTGCVKGVVRPKVLVPTLALFFFGADLSSTYLRDQAGRVTAVDNAYVARALVLGTVAERKHAVENFLALVPERLWTGSGDAASPWVDSKFGGAKEAQKTIAASTSHNVVVESLWYVGLPGLALLVLLVAEVARCAFFGLSQGGPEDRKVVAVLRGTWSACLCRGGQRRRLPHFLLLLLLRGSRQVRRASQDQPNAATPYAGGAGYGARRRASARGVAPWPGGAFFRGRLKRVDEQRGAADDLYACCGTHQLHPTAEDVVLPGFGRAGGRCVLFCLHGDGA